MPVFSECLPLTHVRSLENCQRLFTRKPKAGQPFKPIELYGMLPTKFICGGPAVVSRMPPLGAAVLAHNRCGQFAPAARWLPPMNQRSYATVEWFRRLSRMIQSNC